MDDDRIIPPPADVLAIVAAVERARGCHELRTLTDLALYGTCFVKDGERIDPRDVVFVPDSTVSNGTRVTVGGSGDGQFRITYTREPTGYIEAEPRSLLEQLEQFEELDPDKAEHREFVRRFMGIDHAAAEKPSQTVWVDRERFVWASANNLEPMKIVEWSGEPKADEWRSLKPGELLWIDDTCGSVVVTDLPTDEHRADEVWLPEPDDRPEQVAAALTSWLDLATEKGWPADEKVLQGLVDAVERYRCYRGGR